MAKVSLLVKLSFQKEEKCPPVLHHCLPQQVKEDIIGGEAAGRGDNLEAITMTATTTQMGWPGGGSSHTPRLNTLT